MLDDFVGPSDPTLMYLILFMLIKRLKEYVKNIQMIKNSQIIGFIHDIGKVLFSFGEPSWAVVGYLCSWL